MTKFKIGDKVRCIDSTASVLKEGKEHVVEDISSHFIKLDDIYGKWRADRFELVEPEYKQCKDLTDAELGALVRAWTKGKRIEFLDFGDKWEDISDEPRWLAHLSYRVKPEPVRTTATLMANSKQVGDVDFVDGVVDKDSVRWY